MDGHRNYEITRRRIIHESVRVIAPNEVVAQRIATNTNAWREVKSEGETIVSVSVCEPHGRTAAARDATDHSGSKT